MGKHISSAGKRFIVGLWLTFLYIICVSLVVFSLSAYLFQVKVNSLPKDKLNANSQFKNFYCDTSKISADKINSLSVVPCLPAPVVSKFYTSAELLRKYSNWKNLSREAQSIREDLDEFNLKLEQIKNDIKRISKLAKSDQDKKLYNKAPQEIEQLEQDEYLLSANIEHAQTRLEKIDQLINPENSLFSEDQLTDIYTEIDGFQTFFRPINFIFGNEYYWAVPKPILKIVLILSMGVLGSLIFVTIEFIKEPIGKFHQRCTMYFFRPFLGMILALAMYVMIKSGQSTILGGNEEDLSPFLISFLGIISGMLAEKTYQRLALTGGKVLGESGKNTNGVDKNKGG